MEEAKSALYLSDKTDGLSRAEGNVEIDYAAEKRLVRKLDVRFLSTFHKPFLSKSSNFADWENSFILCRKCSIFNIPGAYFNS